MIEFGHLTHPGMRRELNEDTYYGDSELALWLGVPPSSLHLVLPNVGNFFTPGATGPLGVFG